MYVFKRMCMYEVLCMYSSVCVCMRFHVCIQAYFHVYVRDSMYAHNVYIDIYSKHVIACMYVIYTQMSILVCAFERTPMSIHAIV